MNVLVEVKGLGYVDFSLAPFGWVRDPRIEFCGVNDEDLCKDQITAFFNRLQPVPFENTRDTFVESASKDLQNAVEQYRASGKEVIYVDTILVAIRPIPKSSRDSTPEEIAEFIGRMGGA